MCPLLQIPDLKRGPSGQEPPSAPGRPTSGEPPAGFTRAARRWALESRRKRPQKPENQVCYWLQLCIILNQQHSYPKSFKKLSGPEPAEVQGLKNHSTNTANNNRRRYLRLGCVGMCSLRLGCVGFSGVFRAALLPGRWLAWGFLCMMRW